MLIFKLVLFSVIFFWAIVESSLCIVAACLPSLRSSISTGTLMHSIHRAFSFQPLRSSAASQRSGKGTSNQGDYSVSLTRSERKTSNGRNTFRDGLEIAGLASLASAPLAKKDNTYSFGDYEMLEKGIKRDDIRGTT